MSSSLYWMPLPTERKENAIGYLKHILMKKVWNAEPGESCGHSVTVDETLIPFLEGIAAASDRNVAKDAERLIAAIEKHGKVELSIHS